MYNKYTSGEHFEAMAKKRLLPLYPYFVKDLENVAGSLEGKAILEIGCGPGFMLEQLSKARPKLLVGVDISQDMLNRAKTRCGSATLIRGDVSNLPLDNFTFDVVFSRGSVFFWKNLPLAFSELQRVTKANGCGLIGGGYGLSTPRDLIDKIKSARTSNSSNIPKLNPHKLVQMVTELGDKASILSKKGSGFWLHWIRN